MAAWSRGKRRRNPSVSSSYENDPCFSTCSEKRFPKSVSKWDIHFLEKLGINYDPKAISLSEFLEKIKIWGMERRVVKKPFPSFIGSIEKYTARVLNFSFPETPEVFNKLKPTFVEEFKSLHERALATIMKIKDEELELQVQERDDAETGEQKSLFTEWAIRIKDFMKYYKMFLHDEVRSLPRVENRFTELFMTFSRIFYLVPQSGKNECIHIQIGKMTQPCIPDVRFLVPIDAYYIALTILVMHTEVEQCSVGKKKKYSENDDGEEIFDIRSALSKNILGQFGGELLAESERSAFYPGVVGTICMGTEVIFAFMDMQHEQFVRIKTEGESAESSCTITYTKPYNYLLEKDRNELLPLLFWLGFLQTFSKDEIDK